jgi:hypothetical protein
MKELQKDKDFGNENLINRPLLLKKFRRVSDGYDKLSILTSQIDITVTHQPVIMTIF